MGEHVLHKKDAKKAPQKSLKEKRQEKKDKKKKTSSESWYILTIDQSKK